MQVLHCCVWVPPSVLGAGGGTSPVHICPPASAAPRPGPGEPWRRAGRQAAGGAQSSGALTETLAPPGPARLSRHPAPAGRDPWTQRPARANPLSCRRGGGRGAARRGRIPAARAGDVAEPGQPDAPGLQTPADSRLLSRGMWRWNVCSPGGKAGSPWGQAAFSELKQLEILPQDTGTPPADDSTTGEPVGLTSQHLLWLV